MVDPGRLRFPGNVLHEAGHLAVATPQGRAGMDRDAGKDAAEEMMAIGWSYAAALHLGLDPAVVFHEGAIGAGRPRCWTTSPIGVTWRCRCCSGWA